MLCINYDRGSEGNYEFNFMSDRPSKGKLADFTDIFYKKNTEQLIGAWETSLNTAGGCS